MNFKQNFVLQVILAICVSGQSESYRHNVRKLSSSDITQCTYETSACPTWLICNSQNHCECRNGHDGAIICNDEKQTSAVLICHCVTHDAESNSTFFGSCFYNCEFHHKDKGNNLIYNQLPKQPRMLLNNSVCTPFYRTGLLCGDCEEGYSPLVLSYDLSCVECPDGHKNWWKFALVGFVPLIFFYIFVVFFSINVTSSYLHGVVWFSQNITTPAFIRTILFALNANKSSGQLIAAKILISLFSYWNLDFFRSFLPNICLKVSTLQALALDYLVALYPFMLILLSYFTIELYDRKCTIIVTAWKPFKKIFTFYRMSWDIRTSIIDSFATFFLLSYMKILSVSTDLLIPTIVYQLGSNKSMLGLYYSPTVVYFGDDHRMYAVLAIVILMSFVIIPTAILVLYPCQFFQRFLSLIHVNWHFLHAFVDSFQGCYKDGTEPGTLDCRWFSAIMLLQRLLFSIILGLTLSALYHIYAILILGVLLIAIINIQPFKILTVGFLSTDFTFFSLLTFTYIAIVASRHANIYNNLSLHIFLVILSISLTFIPILYTFFLIGS